jgi:hypothetical protein
MTISKSRIDELMAIARTCDGYEGFSSFTDPHYVENERDYKEATVGKAHEHLSESELRRLIAGEDFEEFVSRLETIGKDSNLLWCAVPRDGDLGILYQENLDKPAFFASPSLATRSQPLRRHSASVRFDTPKTSAIRRASPHST